MRRSISGSSGTCAGPPVLVTGAGGYIGSALVNAIAAAGPSPIVLLDSSAHNLAGTGRHEAVVGSVTDAGLLDSVFSRFRPSVVYHAAALKHVAPLELDPLAAVRVNAMGTYTLAQAALRHGVSSLVLVSTDKAVNPHSIMGASKRLAELTVAALGGAQCRMNAVRLGNVIGSSGSVLPIFLEQISRGGPVTVTHPEVARYFITPHDAVAAILAGGAAECTGRILLPELGEPRRIAELARSMVGAAANGAGKAIEIRFIGLRPGEKLNEDLMYRTEVREGYSGSLAVVRTPSPTPAELHGRMEQIARLLAGADLAGIVEAIQAMVPEYQPSSVMLAAMATVGSGAGSGAG